MVIASHVDMWLHTTTEACHPFSYDACGEGVGYFTKDRRNRGHVPTHLNGLLSFVSILWVWGGWLVIPLRIEEYRVHVVAHLDRSQVSVFI
jgi:hypothetical protein